MGKKITAFAVAVMIAFTTVFAGGFSDAVYAAGKDTVSAEAQYIDGATGGTVKVKTEYSDKFFAGSAKKENAGLRKLSVLAASAVYDEKFAGELMKFCGFTFEYENVTVTKEDNDHVSYAIGHKKIGDSTVIAVWVKGTSADYEWISNFNLGNTPDHEGFSIAEEELDVKVENYLVDHKIKDGTKYWITGHSRGAAVANLLAKRKTDEYGQANVYAYTFATPRVSTKAKKKGYENIRNYINPGDFVTEVAPAAWGYGRYGKDYVMTASAKKSMQKKFKKLTGEKYAGFDKKEMKKLLKAFMTYTGEDIQSYYTERDNGVAPATFCKDGLAAYLAGDAKAYLYLLYVSGTDADASAILESMNSDDGSQDGFAHAHSPSTYIAWIETMK